jgi:hypothetical protein
LARDYDELFMINQLCEGLGLYQQIICRLHERRGGKKLFATSRAKRSIMGLDKRRLLLRGNTTSKTLFVGCA